MGLRSKTNTTTNGMMTQRWEHGLLASPLAEDYTGPESEGNAQYAGGDYVTLS